MRSRKSLMLCLGISVLTWSCQQQPTPAPDTRAADEAAIRAADTEWAKAATAKDLERALSYCTDDASLLAPNAPAATSKEAVRKVWSDMLALPGLALSWQPTKVEAARSGDFGYSIGTYEMTVNDPSGKPVTDRGKYMTVWNKQADGSWKCVADMFNTDLPLPAAK